MVSTAYFTKLNEEYPEVYLRVEEKRQRKKHSTKMSTQKYW